MTIDLDALADLRRLRDIATFDVFSPVLKARLDDISRRTARALEHPVGLVTVVLDTAQFNAGEYGLRGWSHASRGVPVEWSFCAHAVCGRAVYVVEDAGTDPAHATNPVVVLDGIRAYAGVPLMTSDGHVIGTHCVANSRPHRYTQIEIERLHAGAQEALDAFAAHRRDTLARAAAAVS